MEHHGGPRIAMEHNGGPWNTIDWPWITIKGHVGAIYSKEKHGGPWRAMEGNGEPWRAMEG